MGEEVTIPNAGGEDENKNDFTVPEDYREKGWAKDLTSIDGVFKKLDGAETLLGRRPIGVELPKENATPEEMASFYGSLGRPGDAKDYKFNREGQSEAMKEFNSDEVDNNVKGIFHKWGLRPDQAIGIQTEYETLVSSLVGDKLKANKELDGEFEKLTTETFGSEKDTILENAKILLEKHIPKGFENYVEGLDNKTLTVMAGVLNEIKSKYISEDVFNNINNGGGGSDNSVDGLRKKANEIMTSKEYNDPFSPLYEQKIAEAKEIYAKIAQMG